MRALPGVRAVEGGYAVPVRLVNGHRDRLSALQGHFAGAELARLIDDVAGAVALPAEGWSCPRCWPARWRRPGDRLRIELLAAPREVLDLPVAAIIRQGLGQEAHIAAPALFAALRMRRRSTRSTCWSTPTGWTRSTRRSSARPRRRPGRLGRGAPPVRRDDGENLLTMVAIYTIIGVLIAIGVVYNAARIQLSERAHELASLRVLGFSRAEVGFVLVGEMMLLTLLAVPLGWVLGSWFAAGMVEAVSTDVVQLPFHISRRTYARRRRWWCWPASARRFWCAGGSTGWI
jgi:putative ABC transport system permease protein